MNVIPISLPTWGHISSDFILPEQGFFGFVLVFNLNTGFVGSLGLIMQGTRWFSINETAH